MLETTRSEPFDIAAFTKALEVLDDDNVADMLLDAQAHILQARLTFEAATEHARTAATAMEAELIARMRNRGATALAHESLDICLVQRTELQKDVAALRALAGLVPEPELRKALCLVQPEPQWKADAVKLRALAKKYGGHVADIVARAVRHVDVGPARLSIARKELR